MAEKENKAITPQAKGDFVKRSSEKLPFMQRVKKWFRDMRSELKKVVWPTPKQVSKNTGVALAMMAVSALVVWGFDKLIESHTGIETYVAEDAISCVAYGTGKSLDSLDQMQDGTMNLSRRKQMNY